MTLSRARIGIAAPLIAGLFALNLVLPRAALLYHVHSGGERAHAHADDVLGIGDLLEDRHHHEHGAGGQHHSHAAHQPHARAQTAGSTSAATLAADDGGAGGHWHEQQRYQRALPAPAPLLILSAQVADALQHPPTCSGRAALLAQHARAPPVLPSLS